MKKDINIDVRYDVLKYSLSIEYAINSLLLAYLGILGKSSTKLFGNKAGISFKNKIDLLYDIDVLSKDEHGDLELLMNFRNKFLHDINCNTFLYALENFDNGIRNKFKKRLDNEDQIENEEFCKKAYTSLYVQNIKVIKKKVEERRIQIYERAGFIETLFQRNVKQIDLSFNLVDEILKELELAELENPKVAELARIISSKCVEYNSLIQHDKEMIKFDEKIKMFFANDNLTNMLK